MLRVIIGLVFLVVLVLFVLSNTAPLQLRILSYDVYHPVATGLVLVLFSATALLVGALLMWFSELGQRRRARRAEAQVRALETRVSELTTQIATAARPAPYAPAPAAITPGVATGPIAD
jgi:lipopolysaccharide assembly protein A